MAFALEGVKVVETATALAGPVAGRLPTDWGAHVIHIEHPVRGDTARSGSAKQVGRGMMADVNYHLGNFNRNKKNAAEV